jgi:hypothetical protein
MEVSVGKNHLFVKKQEDERKFSLVTGNNLKMGCKKIEIF